MLRAHGLDTADLVAEVVRSPSQKTADPRVVEAARREAARRLILQLAQGARRTVQNSTQEHRNEPWV